MKNLSYVQMKKIRGGANAQCFFAPLIFLGAVYIGMGGAQWPLIRACYST